MSKEFVPGVGLMTPPRTSGNETSSNSPYWSPSTKRVTEKSVLREETTAWHQVQERSGMAESSLVASAREFVPSTLTSSSTASLSSGMNSSASEWKPSNTFSGYHDVANSHGTGEYAVPSRQMDSDPLVEVSWNDGVYVVPASMAYAVGELTEQQRQQSQPSSFDGMEWTEHLNSLPAPQRRSLQTIGIPEPVREHFQGLDIASLRQMDPEDERYKEIPTRFHSAYPLDDPSTHRGTGGTFGYPSVLYKVVDRADGQVYTLRRLDNVRTITSTVLSSAQSSWVAIRHPSIVSLYSIHTEKGAVFFTHAYHPSAQTLQERFVSPSSSTVVSESLLWRLISQLLMGIRHVHSRNLAIRSLSASHVLVTSGARFRIANAGVVDVLEFESRKSLGDLQVEDLYRLGCLVLSVATRSCIDAKTEERGMAVLKQSFSQRLYQTVGAMLSGARSVAQICQIVSEKISDELDFALASSDALHSNLQNEYENGRLLRLLVKLGCINERPEHASSPAWSETGDRYVLKLFRDYVFHQTDVDGTPQLDMGHVISSLNKLDVGEKEQILLSSRDGKDVLVASFYDINRCLDAAFVDLTHQSNKPVHQPRPPEPVQPQVYGAGRGKGSGGRGGLYVPYNSGRGASYLPSHPYSTPRGAYPPKRDMY